MDEWTHFLHDASGNAVSRDSLVGPPKRLQWVGGPTWARSHEHLASVSALVSSAGRIFYIVDEGAIAAVTLPPSWFLVARDAFNGVTLWKRPIPAWEPHLREFRSGPPNLARRLVAVRDRVHVTLGYGVPLTALDAATGQTVRTFEGTEGTEEIILADGVLLVAVAKDVEKRIRAVEAESGKMLWQKQPQALAPLTLATSDGRVVYRDGPKVACVDLRTGAPRWESAPTPTTTRVAPWYAPTLVLYRDVVLLADGQKLTGLSAKTGQTLWSSEVWTGYNSPSDVLVAGGLVWTGKMTSAKDSGFGVGRDPLTGEIRKQTEATTSAQIGMAHHRCYRNKATERYLLLGRAGIEFLDVSSCQVQMHHWVRGTCQYGVMPANGLLYAPPHACACYLTAKLNGFNALASARVQGSPFTVQGERLERGGQTPVPKTENPTPRTDDWPTYRHDPARSGCSKAAVRPSLRRAWQADVGGKLSAVVVADGKVFVAAVDSHTVHALDAGSGRRVWRYTAGGRVDGPPTIARGLAVFGCADGWVYCLRAADGQLVWRFRAAPEERRI
ncbi:MAG: hypothetical protein FJ278_03610, partial [Planctomycetes bacterium]|nr:hypothetical protein [Planctomycetota bacterium]